MHSADRRADEARRPDATELSHPVSLVLGTACRAAFEVAPACCLTTKRGAKWGWRRGKAVLFFRRRNRRSKLINKHLAAPITMQLKKSQNNLMGLALFPHARPLQRRA
ncbi:hypothetical protein [Hymenobacter jejuensis]|uniref:Uncharacterized protein n=1 Tax=Hymenobacter jejuensis TaxID=2502781 RepID=A0A5B8A2W1_9BACT|nr:hypothetical protein [Hymenobacter jejuensis]QDA61744.1 hypothetical protein FHG12_17310 [Hymenobacter jejuensis]